MILGLAHHPAAQCFQEIDDAVSEITGPISRGSGQLVVFNAHNFVPPKGSIVYNLENLAANPHAMNWPQDLEVWEYNKQNLPIYPKAMNVRHVPIGYHPSMERFERNKTLDIDILFYGYLNERRERLLRKLAKLGFKVEVIQHGLFGKERDKFLSRTRLAINIHYYITPSLFESVRVSHMVSNRVPVLTEESVNKEEESWGLQGVPYEKLLDTAVELLKKPQSYLEETARVVLSKFKEHPLQIPVASHGA